jgi:hypothetical protein
MHAQYPFTNALKQAFAQAQREMCNEECPSLEAMTDYTTGLLATEDEKRLLAHIEACSLCAATVIELREAFQLVIALDTQWFGWRGPLLYAMNRLAPENRQAWEEHCRRSLRSCQRTQTLEALFTRRRYPA